MLLEKIELENFRQFKGKQTINFSKDENKNITLVFGENGGGKTTLAQAFHWVLYGENEFNDKNLLNCDVIKEMQYNDYKKVSIKLFIKKKNIGYIFERSIKYAKKNNKEARKVDSEQFSVSKTEQGNQTVLENREAQNIVQETLPKELSNFFIFDGERIRKLSAEIDKGKSDNLFGEAVRGLLGLTAMQSIIKHLGKSTSTGTNTVIGRYNKKIDSTSLSQSKKYSERIQEYQEKIKKCECKLSENKQAEITYKKLVLDSHEKLNQIIPEEDLQKEREKYLTLASKSEKRYDNFTKEILSTFNKKAPAFFLKAITPMVMKELQENKSVEKSLPDIQQRTIELLIDRKKCVCGREIRENSEEYKTLRELQQYLPPQSIASSIRQFTTETKSHIKNADGVFKELELKMKKRATTFEEIKTNQQKADNISDTSVSADKAKHIRLQIAEYNKKRDEITTEQAQINRKIGEWQNSVKQMDAKRKELILVDKENQKNNEYKTYAEYISEKLTSIYKKEEAKTRETLEDTINKIFEDIYEGGMHLSVDDKYNIKVSITDPTNGDKNTLERSTAQNYSIIFAFIAGIIQMAKENKKEKKEDSIYYDESEGYPLIMDAPLSAFDKKRIKNICETLPDIAQQIIFFIKDTDGKVAQTYLQDRIGTEYSIKKDTLTTSTIEEKKNV